MNLSSSLLLLLLLTTLLCKTLYAEVRVSKNVYYGYISENIRVDVNSDVYIRFIESEKPFIIGCELLREEVAPLRITSGNEDDYFEEPIIDNSCYIQLKLKSNREQLNREAVDMYRLNVMMLHDESNFQIIVQVLDDNDNDPLFDKYEYNFEINDLVYLPAFSIVGQIRSDDADLARNAEVFYFLNTFNPLFGCVRTTGEIYLKYDTRYMFSNFEKVKDWLNFEAKSIDNGPKLDFYDYLVDNQTIKAFKQQNVDTTMVYVNLNQRGLNDIKSNINLKLDDNNRFISLDYENFDENYFYLKLNQINGKEFIKFSLDKLINGNYSLNYELVDDDTITGINFDANITLSIDVCLKMNQICVQKLVYSQNVKQLFNGLCKFELDMQSPFNIVELEQNLYKVYLDEVKIGDNLVKINYKLINSMPYYLNINLCKYMEMRMPGGFKFEYIGNDSAVHIDGKTGVVRLKNATKSFSLAIMVKNFNNLVDNFNFFIEVDASKATSTSRKRVIPSRILNKTVQIEAISGILNKGVIIYDLQSSSCQIETDNNLFKIKSGSIVAAYDYKFDLNDIIMNNTQTFTIKIQCKAIESINLTVYLQSTGIPFNLPMPYLNTYLFNINEPIAKIKFYSSLTTEQIQLNQIYKISYKFLTMNDEDYEKLPFRYDLNTNQLYYLNKTNPNDFKFKILFIFKFKSIEEFYLQAQVNFQLKTTHFDPLQVSDLKCDTSTIPIINFLNVPKWATYLQLYGKSQLLGFVRLKGGTSNGLYYELYNVSTGFNQSLFELNTQNGALYLNDNTFTLLRRQYQQQRLIINIFVRVNSSIDSKMCRVRIRIQPNTTQTIANYNQTKQEFFTNTNNLLNFLIKGNEFVQDNIYINENTIENSVVLNLKEYLKRNFNAKKYYQFESVLNNLNFSLAVDNPHFYLDTNSSNLLTKYQFNYETQRSFNLKIKINQYLNEYEYDEIDSQVYTYYLDLNIKILNRFDELLATKWPIYYLSFNLEQLLESEDETITLFKMPLADFESNSSSVNYKCTISNKSLRGIFHATKNLTIVIDRDGVGQVKANNEYELDVKISDNFDRAYKLKLLITFVDDQIETNAIDTDDMLDEDAEMTASSTKPIVNDINLNIYDHIYDISKPLTQIIVFNLDHKSTYVFQLTRVQVQFMDKKQQQKSFNKTYLNSLFQIESSNGFLYALQSQMPCSNCTFSISYRINKTTPIYSRRLQLDEQSDRVSDYYDYNSENGIGGDDTENFKVITRRGLIKLQILKLEDQILDSLPIKTFKLGLNETIYLNKNLKLGEKLTEIRPQHDLHENITLPNQKVTNFFLLNNEDLTKQIFYLSNHDGSLYLIRKLNFNLRQTFVFNLTIQITNMLGQYEFYNLNVCLNNKRPRLNVAEEQSYEIDVNLRDINQYFESKMFNFKQAISTELEENVYKIESCYYYSSVFNIAKNFTTSNHYPLCNEMEFDKKTATLQLKIDAIIKFLVNSSDLLVSEDGEKWIKFQLDYSVFNSLSSKSDWSRFEVKINFKDIEAIRRNVEKQNDKTKINDENAMKVIGFKKPEYYFKISKNDVGLQLIDFSGEIQIAENLLNFTFKPFDLSFNISNPIDFLFMIKNFGVIYLKNIPNIMDAEVFKVNVNCNYLAYSATTTLVIEIMNSQEVNEIEWISDSLDVYLNENSPVLSLLETADQQILRLTNKIRNYSAKSFLVFRFIDLNWQKYLELDQNVGTIRTKFTANNLFYSNISAKVVVCKLNEFCKFNDQNKVLTINLRIKKWFENDKKTLIEVLERRKQLKSSELMPGLTILKVKSEENIQIQTTNEKQLFNMIELENGEKEVYLTTGENLPSNLNIKLMALNIVDTECSINIVNSQSVNKIRQLDKITLNMLVEDDFIYSFNSTEEIQLLNYRFMFYITNNYLFVHSDRLIDSEYELYFQEVNKTDRYLIKVEINRKAQEFFLPQSTYFSTVPSSKLNINVFSRKLNMSVKLDDLLDTNQTEPLIILNKNSSIMHISYELSPLDQSSLLDSLLQTLFKVESSNGYLYINKTSVNELNLSSFYNLKKFLLVINLGDVVQNELLELHINLIDGTDRTPIFNKTVYYYELSLDEIDKYYLIDNFNKYLQNQNQNLFFYDLIEGDDSNQFLIDFQNGDLFLRNFSNSKIKSTYVLILKCFNSAQNEDLDFTNLTVFLNFTSVRDLELKKIEQKLEFTKQEYLLQVDENLPIMSLILKLNEKLDSKTLNYPIKFDLHNHADKFYINSSTGYLYTKVSFDYETLDQFNLNVVNDTADLVLSKEFMLKISASSNNSKKSNCFVRVRIQNLNDNKPKFSVMDTNYRVILSNFTTENIFITKLYASDLDIVSKDQDLVYSIANTYKSLFYIDDKSGNLYLNRKLFDVSSSSQQNFSLTIIANDTLFSTLLTINVQVVEPSALTLELDSSIYNSTINEDALPGTHVITLSLNNNKDDYKYYILKGDLYNQFELNSNNGKLYTRLLLDREFISMYSLSIMAIGRNSKVLSNVYVYINDINDNRPICNDSVRYFNSSNMINAQFYAYDADIITKYHYSVSSKASIPVKIDSSSGVFSLNENFTPKLNDNYEFHVRIADQDNYYCITRVIIHLDDFDLFKSSRFTIQPRFLKQVSSKQIYENAPKYSIIDVLNIDDSSMYGLIKFNLITDTQVVRVHPKYGYVQVNTDSFDRELLGNWLNFTVQVASSTCNYHLEIIDRNDNLPHFGDAIEAFMDMEENLEENTFIFKLNAFDNDKNGKILYKILTHENNCCSYLYDVYANTVEINLNDTSYFYLNENTGELFTKKMIDFESHEQFIIYFIAIDPEYNYTTVSLADLDRTIFKLNIRLIDLNDNHPEFDSTTKKLYYLEENCALNTTVSYIKAFDLDKTDDIRFSIVNNSNTFAIDEHTGRLFTTASIDYEQEKEYMLRIRIENPDEAHFRTNFFDIRIEVVNLNDNKPKFMPENETLIINENFPIGKQIHKLKIIDHDLMLDDNYNGYTFLILNQNLMHSKGLMELTKPLFSINKNTSLILIDKPIKNQTYLLQVRVYDENLSLFADTWLTIFIAKNIEPTVVSLNVIIIENQYSLLDNQLIFNLNQKVNPLEDDIFKLDANGNLRLSFDDEKLLLSSDYTLKIASTLKLDVKFIKFYEDCLNNLVRLKINYLKNDYLDELKLMLKLLFNLNSPEQVTILSNQILNSESSELLFAITRNSNSNQCYSSKLIKKFLLRNSDYLQQNYKIKLLNVKYVSNCNTSSSNRDICFSNSNCKMNFFYNITRLLCTNETDCILYPSYKLSCPSLINYHAKTTTNPCKTANPCQNDGICKHVTNSKKTKVLNCFCKDGFTGKHCERDVDECDLYQPCYNASQCQNTYGGFICNCSNNDCYNLTFQELYSKLSNKNYHQSTSISSSLSSILADGRTFHHNFEVHNNNSDTSERSFLSLLKSKDTLLGIFSGIFIVIFVFVLILIISLFVYKLKTIIKKPKIPESTSTSNRDIDEIEDDDEDDEPHTRQTTSKGFFKRKAKTYSSTSSRKKLAVNNNNVKLKLLNNDLNINSVHNTFQREIRN